MSAYTIDDSYDKKNIAVYCENKDHKDDFTEIGGKWRNTMKTGSDKKGWLVPVANLKQLKRLVNKLNKEISSKPVENIQELKEKAKPRKTQTKYRRAVSEDEEEEQQPEVLNEEKGQEGEKGSVPTEEEEEQSAGDEQPEEEDVEVSAEEEEEQSAGDEQLEEEDVEVSAEEEEDEQLEEEDVEVSAEEEEEPEVPKKRQKTPVPSKTIPPKTQQKIETKNNTVKKLKSPSSSENSPVISRHKNFSKHKQQRNLSESDSDGLLVRKKVEKKARLPEKYEKYRTMAKRKPINISDDSTDEEESSDDYPSPSPVRKDKYATIIKKMREIEKRLKKQ
jgi:hypothetical protein